ncbi:rab-interacting lysosomal protein [Varanus komodoensis]|uniref:rab-interacting lysosomal protein n=1 Tax=Varanus komodoensis TaxID=61221 RepID=UPI001CF7A6B2|nr:rab-interacting lysosomal protein [Varanus komodoensis]
MLRLKEVVDKQRDEIRQQARDILSRTRDAEALQEQLGRFMSVNEELRRKLAVVQAQLRSALDQKEELDSLLLEARREAEGLRGSVATPEPSRMDAMEGTEVVATLSRGLPGRGSFSREELQQILQERNELKTNLFLVQEELAFYQRELLNDQRIPSILLRAVKSTIKKQRRKIRAKMLGTAEDQESSEEEAEEWLMGPADAVDGHLPEPGIRSFFSLWYRQSSKSSTAEGGSGAWEIVNPRDTCPKEGEGEPEQQAPSCSSSSPGGASSLA